MSTIALVNKMLNTLWESPKQVLWQTLKLEMKCNIYLGVVLILSHPSFINQDGVKREVLEEAGLEFEPISLIGLEMSCLSLWHRFLYVGKSIGRLISLALIDKMLLTLWESPKQII